MPVLVCCCRRSNFIAQLTQAFNEHKSVNMQFSTPEHSQSNGIVKRFSGAFRSEVKQVTLNLGALHTMCAIVSSEDST